MNKTINGRNDYKLTEVSSRPRLLPNMSSSGISRDKKDNAHWLSVSCD